MWKMPRGIEHTIDSYKFTKKLIINIYVFQVYVILGVISLYQENFRRQPLSPAEAFREEMLEVGKETETKS